MKTVLTVVSIFVQTGFVFSQSADHNYIKTTQYKIPVDNLSKITNWKYSDYQTSIQYFDGLGRPDQTIHLLLSPAQTDVVKIQEYDNLGREVKSYLPCDSRKYSASYRLKGKDDVMGFYAAPPDRIASTAYPFSEIKYDGSDLNIIKEQGAAGETWQIGQGHTVKTERLANIRNEVIQWSLLYSSGGMPYAVSVQSYAENQLLKILLTDENGNQQAEFSDKEGRVVLKRSYVAGSFYDTYYLYDDKGNQVMVIPPKASAWFARNKVTDTRKLPEDLLFSYLYDSRYRKTAEKVPAKDWVYYCHDDLDRQILMQDGNLRKNSSWQYTRYDAFSRVVQTGILTDVIHTSRESMQNFYSNWNFSNIPLLGSYVLTETWYDNYDYVASIPYFKFSSDPDFPDNIPFYRLKNKPTAVKTRILGENRFLTTVLYYDKYGRVIQSITENHLDGLDVVHNSYDFEGKLLKTKHVHQVLNRMPVVMISRFEYDHASRLTNTWISIDKQHEVLYSTVKYNALGQVMEKNLHSEDQGKTYLQSVDFSYNIRGWLTHINNASHSSNKFNDDANDLFGMELLYDLGLNDLNGRPLFDGNISGTIWQNNVNKGIRGYGYQYDAISRISRATYGDFNGNLWNHAAEKHSLTGISYDENGNILNLMQNGQTGLDAGNNPVFGAMDELTYSYIGNQLTGVDDAVTNAWYPNADFNDFNSLYRSTGKNEYSYDVNGNTLTDANKLIIKTQYNYINLPYSIEFENAGMLYLYTAGGTKLQQRTCSYDNCGDSMVTVTDYIGNFVYVNHELSYILADEGRIVPRPSGSYAFEYFLKDHLGNTRLVFTTDDNSDGSPDVLQESNYYPYGLTFDNINNQNTSYSTPNTNKYLFNGVEYHNELELNLCSMFYRQYDPQLGRWRSVDPSAENYISWSLYHFSSNNPILISDFNGKDWYQSTGKDGAVIWKEGSSEIEGYKNIGTTYTQIVDDRISITYEQNIAKILTETVITKNDFESQMTGKVINGKFEKKEGNEGNCYVQAGKMVKKSGAESLPGNINDLQGTKGLEYLNSQIDKGFGVKVQVDRSNDGVGDHWVAISSRTTDLSKNKVISYGFADPAGRNVREGMGTSFKLNLNGKLTGNPRYSALTNYTVVNIRKNK